MFSVLCSIKQAMQVYFNITVIVKMNLIHLERENVLLIYVYCIVLLLMYCIDPDKHKVKNIVLTEDNMKSYELNLQTFEGFVVTSEFSRTQLRGWSMVILSRRGLKGSRVGIPSIKQLCKDKQFEFSLSKYSINN